LAGVQVFGVKDVAMGAGGGLDDETVPERNSVAFTGVNGSQDGFGIRLEDPTGGPLYDDLSGS
jgi:hypothetical protein